MPELRIVNWKQLFALLLPELAFLRKKMITKDELLMAKEQLKGNYIFGQESVNNRMYSSGKNLLLLNQVFTVEEVAEGIDLVTMEEIERVH